MLTEEQVKEIWVMIPGYKNRYSISNHGRIQSENMRIKCNNGFRIKLGRILKQTINTKGYLRVALGADMRFKTKEVHRLIALSFVQNPLNKPCVNHKNGDKLDNRIDNLEWSTYSENNQHAQDTGLNRARYSLKQKEAVRKTAWKKGSIPWNKNKKGSQTPWNKGLKKGVLKCH